MSKPKYKHGDMLNQDHQVFCVTTNGFIKKDGCGVMGAGLAKAMAYEIPELPRNLGKHLRANGNVTGEIFIGEDYTVVALPVKPDSVINNGANVVSHCKTRVGQSTPGFWAKADMRLILRSLESLVKLADENGYTDIGLVPPGTGNGELKFHNIKPMLDSTLDDRFTVWRF